jgi:hypothetical protein
LLRKSVHVNIGSRQDDRNISTEAARAVAKARAAKQLGRALQRQQGTARVTPSGVPKRSTCMAHKANGARDVHRVPRSAFKGDLW